MNSGGHRANEYRANSLASTSSQNYNDFVPQHPGQQLFHVDVSQQRQQQHQQHQHSSAMPVHSSHNQWQQHAMQMNGSQMHNVPPPPIPHQIPPPFSQMPQMPWGSQMPPPQGFPNGMPGMGFNYLPQSILQEAYAMSAPVEAADEPFLLSKLLASSRKGESYKDSLNSLHGKNGHSASLWKDYYLDHRERIDGWISMCLEKEKEKSKEAKAGQNSMSSEVERVKTSYPAIKKPSPASFKQEPSPHPSGRLTISAPPVKRGRPRKTASSNHSTPPIVLDHTAGSRRSTINSLTAPAPVFGSRLPAPHVDVRVPEPPSRSPTPPTTIIPHHGRGNKYTQEDREYFIKFIGWRLKHDPTLSRNDLCDLLAVKAPHHTSQSWASHWSGNHDVPDKILAAARGDDMSDDDGSASSDAEHVDQVRRKPIYKDVSTTEDEEEVSESDAECDEDEEEEASGEDAPIKHYSEKDMGEKGGPFTDADLYITAKHIASMPDWHRIVSKQRWDPYAEKYPQRSAKSWAEYYRRNEASLLNLVKRMKKGSAFKSSMNTQSARPTWVSGAKRKAGSDSSHGDTSPKRGRI